MTTCHSETIIYDDLRDPSEYVRAYNALMQDRTNRLRVSAVVKILHHIQTPVSSIADIACGGGAYLDGVKEVLGASRAQVMAIDRQLACAAGYRINHPNANTVVADATALPFRAGSFDLALCLDIIEHLPEDLDFLRHVANLLRYVGHVPHGTKMLPPRKEELTCLHPPVNTVSCLHRVRKRSATDLRRIRCWRKDRSREYHGEPHPRHRE